MALLCMGIVLVTALLGIFAPWVALCKVKG